MSRNLLEKARWDAFFILDGLRGGQIRKRYESDLYAWKHGSSVAETEEKLRKLICHAIRTTDFYKSFDMDAPLSAFPIVDKNIFRERYDEFLSEAYRGRADNRVMSTSGSTGTPLQMVQNRQKASFNAADSIFLESLAGYHIGERMAFLRVWVKNVRKSPLALFAENSIMLDSSLLSDEAVAKMLKMLKKKRVKMITGYSSALTILSNYIREHGIDTSGFSIHSIIPISETLPEPIRHQLERQFDCPVQQTYSNEENGIMAIQHRNDQGYYVNSESYYYEILKLDSNEPAEEGELGRIVITDLTNYAFPIIRYDNGDTAIAKRCEKDGRFHLTLTELYGRRSDILYDTRGRALTPYVITNNLWDAKGVGQYQFVQTGIKDYELRLSGSREEMEVDALLKRIHPFFGEDAHINVVYVDEIPVLASGKRKYIENLCEEYR